jgi:hypothetical protein
MKHFEKDFVERTQRILKEYSGKYGVSLLLNCTLGLIVLPYEKIQGNEPKLWQANIDTMPGQPWTKLQFTSKPRTFGNLLRTIRNGIAHQRIEPVNQGGRISGVIIRNVTQRGKQNLEIKFNEAQLKEFALLVANDFLTALRAP